MKKRPLTLTAGILGTVFFALYVLGTVVILAAFGDLFQVSGVSFTAIAILLIPVAFGIVSLILNACSISAFSASPEKYKRKKGVIIAAIVFNLLEVAFTIYGLAVPSTAGEGNSIMTIVIDVLVMVAIVLASIFYIVDLCLEKKRVEQAPAQNDTQTPQTPNPQQ